MLSRQALKRFLKYVAIGASTSAIDVYLLWILTEHFGIFYLISATLSFMTSATLGYLADRHFVFSQTDRSLKAGYLYFLAITGAGLIMTLSSMVILIEIFGFHYIIARILVVGAIGIWNYLMNLYVNFKVAGRY